MNIAKNFRKASVFGILLILIAIGGLYVMLLREYRPIDHERIVSLGMLQESLVEKVEFIGVSEVFSNICNAEGNELISWRYKVFPWRMINYVNADVSQQWNSKRNLYERELSFRNMTYAQISKRTLHGESILQNFDCGNFITYAYCYEHKYSSYRSTNDETTNILAISGKGTLFDKDAVHGLELIPENLIVLVEVSSHIHWLEPGDINIDDLKNNRSSQRYQLGLKADKRGFYVCFADCQVFYLKKNTPLELLGKLGTIDGAKSHDREVLLKEYILKQK